MQEVLFKKEGIRTGSVADNLETQVPSAFVQEPRAEPEDEGSEEEQKEEDDPVPIDEEELLSPCVPHSKLVTVDLDDDDLAQEDLPEPPERMREEDQPPQGSKPEPEAPKELQNLETPVAEALDNNV